MTMTTLFMMTASTLVVAFFFWKSGRLKNAKQFVATVLVVLVAAMAFVFFEAKAEREARVLLLSVFPVASDSQEVLFYRKATKGTRVQEIEAVYTVTASDPLPVSLEGAAFRYRLDSLATDLGVWTIDQFEIADGALDWKPLPRRAASSGYLPARGHYSSRNWPDEKGMSGSYLCALVHLDPNQTDTPQKVLSCNSVGQKPAESILLLAILDTSARRLHLLVQ
ncbi:hypothetical protein [Roseovarius rhodophyticola]|uniref:Uncharacterized protein n=1 Tax=Roseovarius rhodophyticola TaxID=3080827 RepID=A0ABZ2TD31_9RHOB|nr:hypothetical protein [Roseovarius sp. W115]MDV2931348.1 hypothetical protein [Roseovarius sp. W115]